jgi:nitrite reductase (NO-forming)
MRDSRDMIFTSGLVAGVLTIILVLSPLLIGTQFTAEAKHLPCKTKNVLLIAKEVAVQVTPTGGIPPSAVRYNAMTWNGTIPGPVISVDQCDTLNIKVKNEATNTFIHSLDFHAGYGRSNAIGCNLVTQIAPGDEITCTLHAKYAGVFMYHCAGDAVNGIWEHIANGMYGGIVVHPHEETPAKEFYMVFGEIYSTSTTSGTTGSFNMDKLLADNPDFVLTNGLKFKYVKQIGTTPPLVLNPAAEVFKVKPNELTRWYIVNAGPNDDVAFHFISTMINVHDGFLGQGGTGSGKLGTQLRNDETWSIPAGSASVIESRFPDQGNYIGVDHSMKDVFKGAAFVVLATPTSTPTDHPPGTWVPPMGSKKVTDDGR